MTAAGALTDHDVATVREQAATDRPATVWFTAAAVGVPVGGSAKVVTVGDSGEGEFIQVRPAGSRDTMFCSPHELTRTRPARRRAAPAAEKAAKPVRPTRSVPSVPSADRAAAAATAQVPGKPTLQPVGGPAASPAAARPGRATGVRHRAGRSGEISVNLQATADGEWTVQVLVGKETIVGSVPVPTADVAAAARSLPPAVANAIESSVEGARQRQRERVEQLRAELDAAQRILDQLGD